MSSKSASLNNKGGGMKSKSRKVCAVQSGSWPPLSCKQICCPAEKISTQAWKVEKASSGILKKSPAEVPDLEAAGAAQLRPRHPRQLLSLETPYLLLQSHAAASQGRCCLPARFMHTKETNHHGVKKNHQYNYINFSKRPFQRITELQNGLDQRA